MMANEALYECASYAPSLSLDEDDYQTLVYLVATWLIEVREKVKAHRLPSNGANGKPMLRP